MLAILPQPPLFSHSDRKKEALLRIKAEQTAVNMVSQVWKAKDPPQFRDLTSVQSVLKCYADERPRLTPRDAAAALRHQHYVLLSRKGLARPPIFSHHPIPDPYNSYLNPLAP